MSENEFLDIICITETLQKNQGERIDPAELQFQDFNCFHNLRQKQCHRGVAMWVRKCLGAQQIKSLGECQAARESVWCELTLQDKDCLLVGTVYRSPNSTAENDALVNGLLSRMLEGRSHILIVGDFNHPEINWTTESTPRDLNHPASLFMEAIRDSFLVQHVVKPTHYRGDQTANVLDLVFTNEQEMIDNIRHEAPVGKSHHQTLLFKLRCNTEKKLHDSYRNNFAKGDYDWLRNCVSSQVVEEK